MFSNQLNEQVSPIRSAANQSIPPLNLERNLLPGSSNVPFIQAGTITAEALVSVFLALKNCFSETIALVEFSDILESIPPVV